jgi:4-hydroxy-tetrahydrodipicolinate synthase
VSDRAARAGKLSVGAPKVEALVLLGRLPRAVVRPPLVKLARAEIDRIHVALVKAGLLSAKTARDAA